MLIVVSPAKALDVESAVPTDHYSQPAMLDRAVELVDILAKKTPAELANMMSISDDLAVRNAERFNDFHLPFTPDNARPAMYTFNGDTYVGLDAANRFDDAGIREAQRRLRILSGLYGVLRPLDLIQPYRLEMGTKCETARGSNLYEFWGDTITAELNAAAAEAASGETVLLQLASMEYFRAVDTSILDATVITPRFLDRPRTAEPGVYKVISFHAKRARGSMAGWVVANQVRDIGDLSRFDEHGYRFDATRSTPTEPTFVRDAV